MSGGKTYDLVVVGSGTAAQVASSRVRAAGWSVAVIDHLPFGGTCALRGCDPKKVLIAGAEAVDLAGRMRGRGATGEVGISWPDLIAFKRTFAETVYGFKTLNEDGSERVLGAHLVGPHADEVINLFALAIRHGLTADDLKQTILAYPTGASDIGYML